MKYTTKETIEILGINRVALHYLSRNNRQIFTPKYRGSQTPGDSALYTEQDIQILKKYFELKKELKQHMELMRQANGGFK